MKGCLSVIIKTIIAILVFFGLLHLGVIDFIKEKIEEYRGTEEARQEKMIDKIKVISIAPLFADAIRRLNENLPLGELFIYDK